MDRTLPSFQAQINIPSRVIRVSCVNSHLLLSGLYLLLFVQFINYINKPYHTGVLIQFLYSHHQWQIHMSCEVRDCFEKVCDELLDSIYHEGSILLCQKHWKEISQDPEKLEQLGLKSRVW